MTDTDWDVAGSLTGYLHPTSGDFAFKLHGVSIDAQARFILRCRSEQLIAANRLRSGTKDYIISYVADYGKVMEAWLQEVASG